MERLLALPSQKVDILMAPHHGSRAANTPRLAQWARPRLAIACQGPVRTLVPNDQTYKAAGSAFLGTYPHGAITVRSHATGLVVETFATQQRIAVRSR